MKRAATLFDSVQIRPFICLDCGEISVIEGKGVKRFRSTNCSNPDCQSDNVEPAGEPVWAEVKITRRAARIRVDHRKR